MDASCVVCGFVTAIPNEASAGAAHCQQEGVVSGRVGAAGVPAFDFICKACGAPNRLVSRPAVPRPVSSSVPPAPPPLRRPPQHPPRDDDDPTMIDLRSIALKSFTTEAKAQEPKQEQAPEAEIDVGASGSMREILAVCDTLTPATMPPPPAPPRHLHVLIAVCLGVITAAALAAAAAGVHAAGVLDRPSLARQVIAPRGAAIAWALLRSGRAATAPAIEARRVSDTPSASEANAPSASEANAPGEAQRAEATKPSSLGEAGTATQAPAKTRRAANATRAKSEEALSDSSRAAGTPPKPTVRSMSLVEAMAEAVGEKVPTAPAPAATAP